MRGSRGKLKQTLRNNVEDAFYRARRVVRVLERDGKITFKANTLSPLGIWCAWRS